MAEKEFGEDLVAIDHVAPFLISGSLTHRRKIRVSLGAPLCRAFPQQLGCRLYGQFLLGSRRSPSTTTGIRIRDGGRDDKREAPHNHLRGFRIANRRTNPMIIV